MSDPAATERFEELPERIQQQVQQRIAHIDQLRAGKDALEDDGVDLSASEERDLQDVGDIDTGDYPDAAVENARMALEAREDHGNPNDCGTRVGWERANQLVNGEDLSEETINRMAAFARHEDNKEQSDEEGREDCGWLMWKAWGGDEGVAWAERKAEEFETARENATRALDTPEGVPDNAISISDRSEAPEDASIVQGPGGGLYYVPAGGGGSDGDVQDASEKYRDEVDSVISETDFTNTATDDAGNEVLAKEERENLREGLSEAIGEEPTEEFYDRMRSWKADSYSDRSQTQEKAFAAAFDLGGDVRNGELDGEDPTQEDIALAAALGRASQEFVDETYGGEIEVSRGLSQYGMGQLVANWANDPSAEEIEFNLSAMSNFSTDERVAEKFGDDTAVFGETVSSEDVVMATDFVTNAGGLDEGEISIRGAQKSFDPEQIEVYESQGYLPLDARDMPESIADSMSETINEQSENLIPVLDESGKETLREFDDAFGLLDDDVRTAL